MLARFQYFLIVLLVVSCIEPYEFVVKSKEAALVVEAFISDESFSETLDYPSDGRYFKVKLTETGDVTNHRANPVSGASIRLISDRGDSWNYTESDPIVTPGIYALMDKDFQALESVQYKLQISVSGVGEYESHWEELPSFSAPVMGEIGFTETDIQTYAIELHEQIIKTVNGITANIQIPGNDSGSPLYYRWTFTPMWVYQAPFSSVVEAGHRCWISNSLYLRDYAIQVDNVGGYLKDLFFLPTTRNERIFEDFTALITQQSMSPEFYYFWKEMQEQSQAGAIFDSPPFNLKTNMVSLTGDGKVIGYFGVVHEQAKRWYFNRKDLSYNVVNTLARDCSVPLQDPAPECFNCLYYSFGDPVNVKPSWWR